MASHTHPTRQDQVFRQLREGILSGTLPPGARLPPSRALAEELSVSRQTVVMVYERLASEGYVRAHIGSGTFVAPELPDGLPERVDRSGVAAPPSRLSRRGTMLAGLQVAATAEAGETLPALLAPGVPAAELFPREAWARCAEAVLKTFPADHTRYPGPLGLMGLREQIAAHLAATRGLSADPSQIMVTSGTQMALRLAADLLIDPGDQAWVENPGYVAGRAALLASGAELVPVPSDPDGLDVAAGLRAAPRARLVLTAPSHATPLGGALSVDRRLALLDWAEGADAWVLEDDCDSEFRWVGKPLPPLATLDRAGRVIYCGTFSKTLAPSLRLAFAVLPRPLVEPACRARLQWDRGPATMPQAILAAFMRQGRLAPHVRRTRTEYARRRWALLAAMATHCPTLTVVNAPGGLHLTARLAPGADEAAIVTAAHRLGLGVAPLSVYAAAPPAPIGLVMGFTSVPEALAADTAKRLAQACRSR